MESAVGGGREDREPKEWGCDPKSKNCPVGDVAGNWLKGVRSIQGATRKKGQTSCHVEKTGVPRGESQEDTSPENTGAPATAWETLPPALLY